jgi:type I restriction enzyme S subunit
MTEFPERWARASIGEAATLINGRAFKPTDWGSSGLPIIRIQNLNRPDAAYNFFEGPLDPRHEVRPGELLFAWSGTPGTSFGAHIWSGPRAALNQHIFRVLHSEELLDRKFFREAINNQLDELIRRAHGGAGLAHVTKDKFESIEVPLPSLAEQRRIVAKLEELFSELDAGVAALRRAQRRLTRYRQSLLQAAVTGELTREWREQNLDINQTGDEVVGNILGERQKSWEADYRQRKQVQGNKLRGNDWKALFRPPDVPILPEDRPSLPSGWTWASPAQLAAPMKHALVIGPFGSDLKVSDYQDEGIPLVFVRNIRSGQFRDAGTKFVSIEKGHQLKNHTVQAGDVLITKMGAPPGDACLYPNHAPDAIITADCIKWTLSPLVDSPTFFVAAINADPVKKQIAQITRGVAQQKVSLERFREIAIPVPPLLEQRAIVGELDRRLSAADALDATLQASLRRAERLRQSILERAFRGELVPQDPNDEPAEALLARLKATAADTPAPRRRGRPPRTEPAEPQPPRHRGRPRKAQP